MRIEDILARLEGVRRVKPDEWAARCPAHDDRVGSMTVTDAGERILVRCHAGCGFGPVVLAMGLQAHDLFSGSQRVERHGGGVNIRNVKPAQSVADKRERPTGGTGVQMPPDHVVRYWEGCLTPALIRRLRELKGWSERSLRAVRAGWDCHRVTFPIYDQDGVMVSLVRWAPPGSQARVNGSKSLAVGPRELWPAPESLPVGEVVWLVEGEPDRVSGVELGLTVVSVPGVASWKPGWADRFAGRRVVVCFDCDGPGRSAAAERVGQLRAVGVEAVLVDLFPGRTDGYDLSDALLAAAQDGRVNDLRRYLLRLEDAAWRTAA